MRKFIFFHYFVIYIFCILILFYKNMPNIYIDDKKIEAKQGETIIYAAFRNGVEIPHFCWHPELSVAGNCRMCLVEIGNPKRNPDGSVVTNEQGEPDIAYIPKLQIACNTIVSEGLHVRTKTPKVKKAQEAVMEFLLINHPLDCPICDEAGQCKLQEYTQNYSNGLSRFDEVKNPNPKRVEWNDHIVYDAERCISCGRCIRFTRDIAKEDILTFINRGDKVRIERFNDTKVQNDYSMNVVDICPVGALTSKDFRFKARVWEMSFNDSICPGCSRGCNIKIGVRNNEILRLEPRQNNYVNHNWMCNFGRLTQYKYVNENRLKASLVKENGKHKEVDLSEAIKTTSALLKKISPNEIYFLASPNASLENNYIFKTFAKNIIKSNNLAYIERKDKTFADSFLKTEDKSPNSNGLSLLDINKLNISEILPKIKSKSIKALYLLDENFEMSDELIEAIKEVEILVVHAANNNELLKFADVVFSTATFAEQEGTFVNCNNRVQHFAPALITHNQKRYDIGANLSRLDKFGSHNDKWNQKQKREVYSSWQILEKLSKVFGNIKTFKNSESIFDEISNKYQLFAGMNYSLLIERSGIIVGQAENNTEELQVVYHSNKMRP